MTRTRKIGLKDIAVEAQVSVSAVSMALADHPRISFETRQRIRDISERLGYRVGRRSALRAGAGPSRIVLVSISEDATRPGKGLLTMQLSAFASRQGLRLEVACWAKEQDHAQMIDHLMRSPQRPDGLLTSGHTNSAFFSAVANAGIPCVTLGDPLVETPVDAINFDHAAGARRAGAYMVAKGHRRIGFIGDTLVPRGSNARCLDGLRLALADAAMTLESRYVHITGVVDGGLSTAPDALLRGPSAPTAYLVPNHYLGESVIASLRGFGRDALVLPFRAREAHDIGPGDGPSIVYSLRLYCQMGLERLTYLCTHRDQVPQLIIAPFETVNMD